MYGLPEILLILSKVGLSQGTCNKTSVPQILYAIIHNISGTTESDLE